MLFVCLPILLYALLVGAVWHKMHGLEGVIVGAAFDAALQYTLCGEVLFTSNIHECT